MATAASKSATGAAAAGDGLDHTNAERGIDAGTGKMTAEKADKIVTHYSNVVVHGAEPADLKEARAFLAEQAEKKK